MARRSFQSDSAKIDPLYVSDIGNFYPSISAHYGVGSSTIPFCISRNREKYTLQSLYSESKLPKSVVRERVWQQTQYCTDRLVEQHIPSYLLHEALLVDDALHRKQVESSRIMNSIVKCHHGSQSLIIHTSGANSDDLVLRDISYCLPQNRYLEPGFSLSIGQGRVLKDLQQCGSSFWMSSSHLFARTDNEVFHIKTTDIINEATFNVEHLSSSISRSGLILEPVQKWSLPVTISSMACSVSSYMQAAVLSINGSLSTWTPAKGLKSENGNNPIISSSVMSNNTKLQLHASAHPQCYYLSCDKMMYIKDLRSSGHAIPIIKLPSGKIQSAMIHPSCPSTDYQERYMFMSVEDHHPHNCIIDLRYGAKVVATRYLPEAHETMKSLSFADIKPQDYHASGGLMVGASSKSRQLYVHRIEHRGISSQDNSIHEDESLALMLGSSSSAGTIGPGTCSWEVFGQPVVDRNDNVRLSGFDIISYPDGMTHATSNIDVDGMHDDRRMDDDTCRPVMNALYNAMLVQQSSIGDLYVQRLCISTRSTPPSTSSAAASAMISASSSFSIPSPIQLALPIGVRGHQVSATDSCTGAFKRRAALGTALEKSISAIDLVEHAYPATSSTFTPFAPEQTLRGFEILKVDTRLLQIEKHNMRKPQHHPDPTLIFANMMPSFVTTIKYHPLSLWECWRYVYEIYHEDIDIKMLLAFLRSQVSLVEYHLDLSSITRPTYDGAKVEPKRDPDRYYNDVDEDSHIMMRCHCLDEMMNRGLFCSTSMVINYDDDHMGMVEPCASKDCIVVHAIMFRLSTSSSSSEISSSNSVSISSSYPTTESTSDITDDVLMKLDAMWSSML